MSKAEEKLENVETFEKTNEKIHEVRVDLKDDIDKQIKSLRRYFDRKLEEIYKKHLLREKIIGDEDDCEEKTLMDFVLKKLPDLKSRIKRVDDAGGQQAFILKNF